MASSSAASFSLRQARAIVQDEFEAKPRVYWADLLIHLTIGYACASMYLSAPLFSMLQVLCYLVAGFALFRVGSFIHEIVHFRKGKMLAFNIAWNVLAGIPMLMPSFFYNNHNDHHRANHYGTGQDGEYLPLANGPMRNIAYFFGQVLFLPAAVFLRFFLIAPVSFLHPKLRNWTLERASSFVINLRYRGEISTDAPRRVWAWMELACFLRAAGIVVVVLGGFVPWYRVLLLYALALFVLGLNYVRNLVAHHYRSTGETISHLDQLVDSVNITGTRFLTELFFPLNLRYHALHHLFPTIPYHNLHRAHQRLIAELPASSPYHKTVYPSYWAVVKELIQDTVRARASGSAGSKLWFQRRRERLDRQPATVLDRPKSPALDRPKSPADSGVPAPHRNADQGMAMPHLDGGFSLGSTSSAASDL